MTGTTLIAPDLVKRRIDLKIQPEDIQALSGYITDRFGLAFDFRDTALFIAERRQLHSVLASSDSTPAKKIDAVHNALSMLFRGIPWDGEDRSAFDDLKASIAAYADHLGYSLAN